MALLHPFKGWLPSPDQVADIACVPYDVINTAEARALATGKPNSYLKVVRPEITCSPETDIHADEVYDAGAREWAQMQATGVYTQEEVPSLYIYQLEWMGKTQTGLYSCISVHEYNQDIILKHELTRPDKEEDRTRHMLTLSSHPEPVMVTFKDDQGITDMMTKEMAQHDPYFSFEAEDGVTHKLWKCNNPDSYVEAFKSVPHLYIADGHHRCKSSANAAERLQASAVADGQSLPENHEIFFFPAVVFPMDEMRILAYNRAITQVDQNQIEAFESRFALHETQNPVPQKKGDVCVYYQGSWKTFTLPEPSGSNVVAGLDAELLQTTVLTPVFGIGDPRTDPTIFFVGGRRGTEELEKLVQNGDAYMTFSMFPTSIQELVDVSDAGELMPPKSTWFEPKLRSGLVVHTF